MAGSPDGGCRWCRKTVPARPGRCRRGGGVRAVRAKSRRRLAPSEKYEVFTSVLTGQATQREAGARWGIDRSTVVSICRTAKQGALDALAAAVPGRPGQAREV